MLGGAGLPSPATSDTIVLSTGRTGAVRAVWDASGNVQTSVQDVDGVPDPAAGFLTVGYDPVRKLLAFKCNRGGEVTTSRFLTAAETAALAPLATDAAATAPGSVSLVRDAAGRGLRRLAPGANITLDADTDPACVIVRGTDTALQSESVAAGGGEVSLVSNAAARTLRTLAAGTGVTLDATTDPTRVRIAATVTTTLDALTDAVSTASALALGVNTPAAPAANTVAVGNGAMSSASAGTNNVAVGAGSLANGTGGNNVAVGALALAPGTAGSAAGNVTVGYAAGRGLRNANNNVAVGNQAGASTAATPSDAADNVSVGFTAGAALTTGSQNLFLGSQAGKAVTAGQQNVAAGYQALVALQGGSGNVCVGNAAGSALTGTDSNNTIVGAFAGTAGLSNAVVLADGAGNVRARWNNAKNGVFAIDTTVPALAADDTLALYFDAASGGLNAVVRSAGLSYTTEMRNERPIGATAVTAATTLAAAHRNRFTRVTTAGVTITVAAYAGIVTGAEHEFMNDTTGVVTFAAGTGVTLRSTGTKVNVSSYGAAVLKYLGGSTFLLCGTLE